MWQSNIIIFAVLLVQVYSAPQFITFKDGKLGVNFGGYHAGVGLGGVAGGSNTAGGLFAEAGTPFGQGAKAGLGGAVNGDSGTAGGLYAAATAGGNVNAAAGLGGAVAGGKSVGGGFSTAQAGGKSATSVLVHAEPSPAVQTVYLRKHKPHRHHVHKTVYVGGYAGVGGEVAPSVPQTVVYKTVQPIEKRVDVNVDVNAHGGAGGAVSGEHYGPSSGVTYTKQIAVNSRPNTFFQDIFNIPISTLKAVSGFLSNTAQNTGISVQKSASINAESDITPKHVSPSTSSSSASEAHISVQTPNASTFIDDIFSIPINTLSAVNKFLENNVAGKKRVQVTSEVDGEPTRIRLGPHARRRANKQVVIVQESTEQKPQESN